jgi:hypothetical protein
MTTVRMSAAAALVVLAALADQPVQALPAVQAEFKLSYYPPNPCLDLGKPTLDGQASLYLDGSAKGSAGTAGPLLCSADGSGSTFAVRFEAPTAGELKFDFIGVWDFADGDAPTYAMMTVDRGPPSAAPRLNLGRFEDGVFIRDDTTEWLLVAYPGTGDTQDGVAIGRIGVVVSAVPEPASGLMLLGGLAALAATRRRIRARATAGRRDARTGALAHHPDLPIGHAQ